MGALTDAETRALERAVEPSRYGAPLALVRLFTWLSPAFPIGAYSYSYGIEAAVADGVIKDGSDLAAWLADAVAHGAGFADAVFCAHGWTHADDPHALAMVKAEGEAFASCRARHQETMDLGTRFLSALRPWTRAPHDRLGGTAPLPVAFGVAAGDQGVDQALCLSLYLQSFLSNLVQAGLRLGVCGQDEGLAMMHRMEGALERCAARAQATALEDLFTATVSAEIHAMRHDALYSRIHAT